MPSVVMVHTVKGCPACEELKKPSNFNDLKKLVLDTDPSAKIVIYEHPRWGVMERQNEYPKIGYITRAPTIMVTYSSNMSSNGDPSKVKVLNGRIDLKTGRIEKTEPPLSIQKGLVPLIKEVMELEKTSPTPILPPVLEPTIRDLKKDYVPKMNDSKSNVKVKCKFDLVSYK